MHLISAIAFHFCNQSVSVFNVESILWMQNRDKKNKNKNKNSMSTRLKNLDDQEFIKSLKSPKSLPADMTRFLESSEHPLSHALIGAFQVFYPGKQAIMVETRATHRGAARVEHVAKAPGLPESTPPAVAPAHLLLIPVDGATTDHPRSPLLSLKIISTKSGRGVKSLTVWQAWQSTGERN